MLTMFEKFWVVIGGGYGGESSWQATFPSPPPLNLAPVGIGLYGGYLYPLGVKVTPDSSGVRTGSRPVQPIQRHRASLTPPDH